MRIPLFVFFLFLMHAADARYGRGFRDISVLGSQRVSVGQMPLSGISIQYDGMYMACMYHKRYLGASVGYEQNTKSESWHITGMINPLNYSFHLSRTIGIIPYCLLEYKANNRQAEEERISQSLNPGVGLSMAVFGRNRIRIRSKAEVSYFVPIQGSHIKQGVAFRLGLGIGLGFRNERSYRPACVLPSF